MCRQKTYETLAHPSSTFKQLVISVRLQNLAAQHPNTAMRIAAITDGQSGCEPPILLGSVRGCRSSPCLRCYARAVPAPYGGSAGGVCWWRRSLLPRRPRRRRFLGRGPQGLKVAQGFLVAARLFLSPAQWFLGVAPGLLRVAQSLLQPAQFFLRTY